MIGSLSTSTPSQSKVISSRRLEIIRIDFVGDDFGVDEPRGLALLGYVSGILLVLIYLVRLIVFDPTSPLLLGPAALEGFIVNPVWYVWLGLTFWRGS